MSGNQRQIRIVILGAGFGGVYAFRRLHSLFHNNSAIKLILVNRNNYFLFTPLLHEVATGSIMPENIVEPLRKVLGCCLGEFHHSEALSIDLDRRLIKSSGGDISYDYLTIALGAETNFFGIPGAEKYSFKLKTLEDARKLKNHFIHTFEKAVGNNDQSELESMLRFAVVGGGPTGVELAAEMSEFFYRTFIKYFRCSALVSKINIVLIQRGAELLPQFAPFLRKKALGVLKKKKIAVRLNTDVVEAGKDFIRLNTGEILKTGTIIWTAGIRPFPIAISGKIKKDNSGRLPVKETLQLEHYPEVFALGDIAAVFSDGKPLPALAQVATREAKYVAGAIKNLLDKKPLAPFRYHHRGDLVSLGQWAAVGEVSRYFIWGRFAWWLWRTVYLSKILSASKKVKVAIDWTVNLFMPRDISEI